MGTTINVGLPWPEQTDPIQQGATAIRNLAEALDSRVSYAHAFGTATITFSAATQAQVAVTFPAGRFTQPPYIVMSVQGAGLPNLYALRHAGAPTTTGVTIVANTAAAATGSVVVAWHAVQVTK